MGKSRKACFYQKALSCCVYVLYVGFGVRPQREINSRFGYWLK
ncbi:hypothetical protein [Nostoc sp.]